MHSWAGTMFHMNKVMSTKYDLVWVMLGGNIGLNVNALLCAQECIICRFCCSQSLSYWWHKLYCHLKFLFCFPYRPRSVLSLLSCLGPHVMFSYIHILGNTVTSVAKLPEFESCSGTYYVFDLKEVTNSVLQFPYR